MNFPVEQFAIEQRISEAEMRGVSNAELTSRFDYMTESLVGKLVARVTGSPHDYEMVKYEDVVVPVVSRGNALRMWLTEDIRQGRFIRKWWAGPQVQYDTRHLVARFTYSQRFCPHINIPKDRAHVEFLMDIKPAGRP